MVHLAFLIYRWNTGNLYVTSFNEFCLPKKMERTMTTANCSHVLFAGDDCLSVSLPTWQLGVLAGHPQDEGDEEGG